MTTLDDQTTATSLLAGDRPARMLDADTHEMVPASMWADVFGEQTAPVAAFLMATHEPDGVNTYNPAVEADDKPITKETVAEGWQTGGDAPSAADMAMRVEWLDCLGTEACLIFSSGPGAVGIALLTTPLERLAQIIVGLPLDADLVERIGAQLLEAHNAWCIRTSRVSPRLRPVAIVNTRHLDSALADCRHLMANGVKAIAIPAGTPPGSISPGHPDLDEFWNTFVEYDVPVLFHTGADFGLLRSNVWADYGIQNLVGKPTAIPEAPLDPYTLAQFPMGSQNFLTAMIFGGVFERHPRLRVAFIEVSAYWFGPAIENMGPVREQFRRSRQSLTLTPAEYVSRNVRVSPMWWEPVDRYIERYGLEDCYVFGSDFPHYEGGKDPAAISDERLERLGTETVEKFFSRNAQLLFP